MEKLVVTGGKKLTGKIKVSGSKNVALKALVAACLTEEQVTIHNIPLISDFFVMVEIMKELGATVDIKDHTIKIIVNKFTTHEIPLEKAAQLRTSSMFIAPLLARVGEAIIPNPGGCRLGARPIDRTIDGLSVLGADIVYNSEDGYFHAQTHGDNLGRRPIDRTIKGLQHLGASVNYLQNSRKFHATGNGLHGGEYTFQKNSHTGTETLILAAVLASGTTVLKNAAQEPEIDDLIDLLNAMGAQVKRSGYREITIHGVEKLHGTNFSICPDRNEVVTFAIAALLTKGDITVEGAKEKDITEFLDELEKAGGGYEQTKEGLRFFYKGKLSSTDVTTSIYPGFMTDWQAPWAVLMTQAQGESTIHETVFENKMGYMHDLNKMGAHIEAFKPVVKDPEKEYNFNLEDDKPEYVHAIKITGPRYLHNAVVTTIDIRAGAAVVLAALAAEGESTIFGVEKLDRGYEKFENRLKSLGASVERVQENES